MISLLIFIALLFTRLIGLKWGQPFFFHPDENNMAVSEATLNCQSLFDLKSCFDPHFYAYGQLSLYLARLILPFVGNANYALRYLSALYSVLAGLFFCKLISRDFKSSRLGFYGLIIYIFSPVMIQLAHFGTTESLLILLIILAIYFRQNLLFLSLIVGLASSVKVSSLAWFVLPLLSYRFYKASFSKLVWSYILGISAFLVFSPHNWLNFADFISSINYEGQVASGVFPVFYTEQFYQTIPLLFQLNKILIYGVGPLILLTAILGHLYLIKHRQFYLIIVFWFLMLVSNLMFVKWTRFLAPAYPLILYLSVAGLKWLNNQYARVWRYLILFIFGLQISLGMNFLSIYFRPDVRVEANHWINQNMTKKSMVITESANVVDLPFDQSSYNVKSFFLYNLDSDAILAKTVMQSLGQADYVVVPSRRIYANYSCFWFSLDQVHYKENCSKAKKYPMIDKYYRRLFLSGRFELVASFKRLNDEMAEETFSVFDHPVIRIYKRQ